MKKSFVYFLAVAVMGLTLGLVSQDKMAPAGATGSTGKMGGKKGGSGSTGKMGGKKGGTGSTGKM
jgi:hypothetical protein